MTVDSAPDFRTSATLPAIPGLRFRHWAGPSDYEPMNDVANDSREASGVHFVTPLDGFANFYESFDADHCDKARDVFIVEVDGRLVAYARTEWSDEPDGLRLHELHCLLSPEWRRRGIGRAMLATLEERALEAAREHPPAGPACFQTGALDDPAAHALFTTTGYIPVRHGYEMVRPNLDPVPDARLPEGLEIRPVREEHLRAIWEAADEAFRDAWGYRAGTERDYELFLTDPIQSDRTLWRVAWDGDQVAGQVRAFINPYCGRRNTAKAAFSSPRLDTVRTRRALPSSA